MFKTSDNHKNGGLYNNFFEKFEFGKKMPSKMRWKFWKTHSTQIFSQQIVFFYAKFEFRMFSAFIWCTYCPCKSKIMSFQKLSSQKLANFRSQTRLLRRHLTAKLCNLGWCSKTLQADKDASFHLRWCLGWFGWKMWMKSTEKSWGRNPPPPHSLDRPKSPPWLGLSRQIP